MKELKTIRVEERDSVLHVTLDRPDVHNAFDDELIGEMIGLMQELGSRDDLRAVVLRATGKNFCAGADLNWMSRMVEYSREENIRDSASLAKMYALIDECPLPVVGRIQGAAIGGGVGLVAVCDIAIAQETSTFGLSEVKLGILPSVISPYVIRKIGETHARALFLTGERFKGPRALQIGLVHHLAGEEGELDQLVNGTVDQLRSSGPEAVRVCKRLIAEVSSKSMMESIPYTIEAIAERRVSDEGQGGMKAFLSKEKAPWIQE